MKHKYPVDKQGDCLHLNLFNISLFVIQEIWRSSGKDEARGTLMEKKSYAYIYSTGKEVISRKMTSDIDPIIILSKIVYLKLCSKLS